MSQHDQGLAGIDLPAAVGHQGCCRGHYLHLTTFKSESDRLLGKNGLHDVLIAQAVDTT